MGEIALLGTGMLGSGFVTAFRRKGVPVRVWNRSLDKAKALEAVGAVVAETPADAVRGAERVHLVLADDAAVDSVLEAAWGALSGPVIDHSTLSPAGVAARFARFQAAGRTYLHAPVFMSPSNSRDSTGIMLVSGPRAVVEPMLEVLRPMTGKVMDLGDRVDQAAAFKLFGNAALISVVAAASDVLTIARQLGVDEEAAIGLFDGFDVGPAFRLRGRRIARREFTPVSFELKMARKDLRLMLEAAGNAGLIGLPSIAARMDELIAQGEGEADFSLIGKPK